MKTPAELKPALWGAVTGAVVLAVVGFTRGGWVTGAKAREMMKTNSDAAVVSALAPICAEKFKAAADAPTQLEALKKLASYEQGSFVEKGGWATMPGDATILSGLGRSCATLLIEPKT
jgi:hypothetical protein